MKSYLPHQKINGATEIFQQQKKLLDQREPSVGEERQEHSLGLTQKKT